MTPKDWLDREILKLEFLAALAGNAPHLLRINILSEKLLGSDWRPNHNRAGSCGDRRRIGHVVVMSVTEQDHIRAPDICRFEAKRGIDAAAIEIRIEQNDLAFVGELKIGEARPSDDQRLWVSGELTAG